jgi:hypothetical protein
LSEKEVLYLIIELQGRAIKEYAEDHLRIEMFNSYLREIEWVEIGFNRAGVSIDEYDGSLTDNQDEYFFDGDNYAPTLREAMDKWFEYQKTREDNYGKGNLGGY